jgi:large conductance mechanosensitive channel
MSIVTEFKEFIAKGNVLDLAVGVIIGAAFGKIVASLVADIVMPPISLILGNTDFSNMFVVLAGGGGKHFATLKEAKEAGATVIAFGSFANLVVEFLIVAFVIFLIVKLANKVRPPELLKKDCPECLSAIPVKAKRCAFCTAELKAAE